MSEPSILESDTAHDERTAVLSPILETLRAEGSPVAGGLPLNDWERGLLAQALKRDERAPDWAGALAEAVALQVKLGGDQPADAPPAEQADPSAVVDVAIGIALLEELQRTIDAMIVAGGMADAKRLSGFRNRLSHAVGRCRDRLTDAQAAAAQQRAAELRRTAQNAEPLRTKLEEEEPERPGLTAQRIRGSSARVGRIVSIDRPVRSLIRPLLLGLVGLAAVWAMVMVPRLMQRPIPALTLAELPANPALRDAVARPPSLYVTVDGAAWRELSGDARRDLTDEVGISAQQYGYSGAVVQDERGRIVAEWLKHSGSRVIAGAVPSGGS